MQAGLTTPEATSAAPVLVIEEALLRFEPGGPAGEVAAAWLAQPYRVHQRLLMAWPDGGAGRVLWRRESRWSLRVRAPRPGEWPAAFYDLPIAGVMRPVQQRIPLGPGTWRFRLCGSPEKRRRWQEGDGEAARERQGHEALPPEAWPGWLYRKLAPLAVALDSCRSLGVRVVRRPREWPLRYLAVEYRGTLTVADDEGARALAGLLCAGVGRGKAFGCGLLCLEGAEVPA